MPNSTDLGRIAVEAYHYLYPLVLMEVTRKVSTGIPAGTRAGFGPPNRFSHMRAFPPGDFKEVVRPNFDTLYSPVWIDLTTEPQVISLRRPVDRYFMLPMMDMWTDVFAVIGTRTTGGGAADYCLVPPGWDGRLPDGLHRIDAPTPHVWVIGRTQTNGTSDYEAVNAIQDGFRISPLSTWPEPADGAHSVETDVDLTTPPLDQVNGMTGDEFFAMASGLLAIHPPHPIDQPILARLRHLGITPGEPSDPNSVASGIGEAMARAPETALERMRAAVLAANPVVNGWSIRRAGIGVYGTDYLYRAVIAMVGLGANLPEDAIYPLIVADDTGEPPLGRRDYVLRFEPAELPPVDAFWSVTMYDGDGFPVPNALGRYALGDRDPLHYGDDGSLDIYVSHTDPGGDRSGNWLPAPEGPLGLTMRLYGPKPEVLDGRWAPPPLRRA
jgi:hypothetical protein